MSIEQNKLKNIIEAALMAVAKPMNIEQLMQLFAEDERPSNNAIKEAVNLLIEESSQRGVELKEVASGYRYQAKQEYSEWLSRLWEEKPAKYSRAALETLALIAYRQPVTRAEIEDVRGVGVSSSIIKTMIEREWIRVVGHRDVPGRPALYATTKQFLDYFNMKSLDELPTLAEIKDLEDINPELDLPNPDEERNQQPDSEEGQSVEDKASDNSAENTDSNDDQDSEGLESTEKEIMVNPELDEQDMVSGIAPDQQSFETEQSETENSEILETETDSHLQTDVFDELDDVHTEKNSESFYADQSFEQHNTPEESAEENTEKPDSEQSTEH